jgi:hypothetical protein
MPVLLLSVHCDVAAAVLLPVTVQIACLSCESAHTWSSLNTNVASYNVLSLCTRVRSTTAAAAC